MPHRQTLIAHAILIPILILACALRTRQLDLRPLHTDEAVQADILRTLMEDGTYTYRPEDYHGPVLVDSTLPLVWLSGNPSYSELSEYHLRLVPALYGLALVGLCFLLRPWLGTGPALVAALLTAISPMMVFYSRYYIMETPMLVFLLGFLLGMLRYLAKPDQPRWLYLAAACGALMHATKETFVLSIAPMILAAAVIVLLDWKSGSLRFPKIRPLHLGIGAALALLLSALLFSNFFQNPKAIADSYATYFGYANRAEGSGHEKPWFYYLQLLTYRKMDGNFVWSEAFVLGLAVLGILAAFCRRTLPPEQKRFLRFLSIYALATIAIYSVIPYKTPWSIMAFLHAAILLAGAGACSLFVFARFLPLRALAVVGLAFGSWQLFQQTLRANFPSKSGRLHLYADEDRNPYLYSHTTRRLLQKIVEPMDTLANLHPEGKAMPILVVHPESAWPLPWYFRSFTRVGYFPDLAALPDPVDAPVLIIDADLAPELEARFKADYASSYVNLREDSVLTLYIERSLFERLIASRSKSTDN